MQKGTYQACRLARIERDFAPSTPITNIRPADFTRLSWFPFRRPQFRCAAKATLMPA